ncbi:hypothetical protein HHK36_005616 [Tetracentron sinense]|uniref:tRNA-uridine aminocarboxypropyltransferase n=1 Tax=Tetracentron sinense TaxID=13715 RepID=A0A834ZQP1_TETSI|nr:hypothetical protein HHK36_005616 [Tetracentron sinense]
MGTQAPAKRPTCSSCSKPIRLCLCARIKNPSLDNSVAVTILQHSHERNHPLNSTRIATLGLKNITVATLSDVHTEARFIIHLLKPEFRNALAVMGANSSLCSFQNHSKIPDYRNSESQAPQIIPISEEELKTHIRGSNLRNVTNDVNGSQNPLNCSENTVFLQNPASFGTVTLENPKNHLHKQPNVNLVSVPPAMPDTQTAITDQIEAGPTGEDEPVITATIAKCGFTCSLTKLFTPYNLLEKPDFDQLLTHQVGQDAISKGFVVKKFQKRKLNGGIEFEEYEEFEIVIPPGSVLLFPTKKSIGVEEVDFEVKNLIVLDGTWDKAKRMYHENPWLKLLPHLKLDPSNMSLYSEVRHQPKAGCLSTIESIVCALKAFGDNPEELDDLLGVFESMVGDQRRCKDERLNQISTV